MSGCRASAMPEQEVHIIKPPLLGNYLKQQLYDHVAQITYEFNQFSTAQISAALYGKEFRLPIVYLDMWGKLTYNV